VTNDEADGRYGSVNIAENDSSRFAEAKLLAVITFQTERRHRTENVGHEINVVRSPSDARVR